MVQLLIAMEESAAQQDNPPVRGTQPTYTWEPGVVVVDPYDLPIPEDTPPGEYVLGGKYGFDPQVVMLEAGSFFARTPVTHAQYARFIGEQGYATRDHRAAIDRFGPTPHHRRSFLIKQYELDLALDAG